MKHRLDTLLVERGFTPTLEKAQALIMTGDVLVNDKPVTKAGTAIKEEAEIRIRGDLSPYVGRGGDKLAGAITHFGIDPSGIVALDVGASTGGFTDYLLQHGARKVYAVDVGYNQLDAKLRSDVRVVVMEQTHAKDLQAEMFDPLPQFVTVDVSFISATKVFDSLVRFMPIGSTYLVLVKPQFELAPELIEKGGVVRSEAAQQQAVSFFREHVEKLGFHVRGEIPSALRGAKKGNQEYFVYLAR